MTIHEEKKGAVTVLRPEGPLLEADSDGFRQKLLRTRVATMGRFVLDASALAYADSKGLETLVEVQEELARAGQSLKLCGLNETMREVLGLTELAPRFENYDDVGSAVRSFV